MHTIKLRPEVQEDEEFVFELYASTRFDELERTTWSHTQKDQFLRSQLALQHKHYHTYYPSTSFDIILERGEPVGRLYVERTASAIIVHDIALLPAARGRGIGSYLLQQIIQEANSGELPVQIFVEKHNPAMTLYVRLGFVPVKDEGVYYLMELTFDLPTTPS